MTVDDLQKSITFYEALGFAIDERWEEKGTLLGVMLRAGKSQIGLNQDEAASTRSRSERRVPGSRSSRSRATPSGKAARSRSAIRAVSC